MRISITTPEISVLRNEVEKKYGSAVSTPKQFSLLAQDIEDNLNEYISDTTIQRIWQYKTGYNTVANHSLNVLCRYIGISDWTAFCRKIEALSSAESQLFTGEGIDIQQLTLGARIRIEWLPDRICIIEYLGDNKFRAIETHNSKLCAGDTFTCTQMKLGREMCLDNLVRHSSDMSYVIGIRNGITKLEIIKD